MTLIVGDSYTDRSTAVLTPTRGSSAMMPHFVRVYAAHMEMRWPLNVRREHAIACGKTVDDAYNCLFQDAINKDCAFALTLEDDVLPPHGVVQKLHTDLAEHPEFTATSALYCTKGQHSVPLLVGHPDKPSDAGLRALPVEFGLLEVNVIPMGCALWRLAPFLDMEKPWFRTTETETQDAHLCLKMRAAGYRFAVDTRLRALHLDFSTGRTF